MKIKVKLPVFFISILFLLLWACVPDEFTRDYNTDILWEPTYRGPVAWGSLTIEDILIAADTTGIVYTDTNDLIYVAFREHLDEIIAGEWIEIPDQEFVQVYYDYLFKVPADSLGEVGNDTIMPAKKTFPFTYNKNERIDSVLIKHGFLRCRTRSTLHHRGILTSYSEDIRKNGRPYRDTTIISDTTGNFMDEVLQPIDGYWIYLDNESSDDTSFIKIDFEYRLTNSGIDIEAGEYVSAIKYFEDIEFQEVYGSVGDYDTVLVDNEVFEFTLLEGDFDGVIYFENPRFKLIIENSTGVPLGIDLYDVSAYYASTDITRYLDFVPGSTPFIIKAPKLSLGEVGQTKSTTIRIDSTISNINELTNSNISEFRFSARAFTNPPGSDRAGNFMLDTSRVSVDYEIELPMNIRVQDFILEDTVEFDLAGIDIEQGDFEINSLEIKIKTTNWLPVDIKVQVYMVDSNYNPLDTLFDASNTHILPSRNVVNGIVDLPSEEEKTITVISDNFEAVKDTKYLLIEATMESTEEGQKPVKLYSYYSIDFNVSVKLEPRIETKRGD